MLCHHGLSQLDCGDLPTDFIPAGGPEVPQNLGAEIIEEVYPGDDFSHLFHIYTAATPGAAMLLEYPESVVDSVGIVSVTWSEATLGTLEFGPDNLDIDNQGVSIYPTIAHPETAACYQVDHVFEAPGTYTLEMEFQVYLSNAPVSFATTTVTYGSILVNELCACNNPCACNYNPYASCDDGSCEIPGNVACGPIEIPDGPSSSLELEFELSVPGSPVVTEGVYEPRMVMEMEHSHLGDLIFTLICPNGQEAVLHGPAGASAILGEPVDDNEAPELIGVGYDYVWSFDPGGIPTMAQDAYDEQPLEPGVYEAEDPISALEGCPVNGTWTLDIYDQWSWDNGYVMCASLLMEGLEVAACDGCLIEGCTDPEACNYYEYATDPDSYCQLPSNGWVRIFDDVNGNGQLDTGPFGENYVGSTGYLNVLETGDVMYLGEFGSVNFSGFEPGTYTLSYVDPSGEYVAAEPTYTYTYPSCASQKFPALATGETFVHLSGVGGFTSEFFHCTDGMNQGVYVENTGTTEFAAEVTLIFDASLDVESLAFGDDFELVEPGVAHWNSDGVLSPGESHVFALHVVGPGEGFLGEFYDFEVAVELTNEEGLTILEEQYAQTFELVCAYDPNDKLSDPEGYTDEHYILPDNSIVFTVRFQNTGNWPATLVHIQDQLDVDHLDLDSFEPLYASHNFWAEIDTEGLVDFWFENIGLPGAEVDEPGSHGFVLYRISPKADIQPGDVIENTAYIYFDGNEPIITNTTWHTIFDCAWMETDLEDVEFCGFEQSHQVDVPFAEEWSWTLDGSPLAETDNELTFEGASSGSYVYVYQVSNPLCTTSGNFNVTLYDLPESGIGQNGNELSAGAGDSWQWYEDGEPIPGATDQQYEVLSSGNYGVEVFTGGGLCSVYTELDVTVGVGELDLSTLSVYPNPATTQLRIHGMNLAAQVKVFNVHGQEVLEARLAPEEPLDISQLPPGTYTLQVGAQAVRGLPFTIR